MLCFHFPEVAKILVAFLFLQGFHTAVALKKRDTYTIPAFGLTCDKVTQICWVSAKKMAAEPAPELNEVSEKLLQHGSPQTHNFNRNKFQKLKIYFPGIKFAFLEFKLISWKSFFDYLEFILLPGIDF